MGAKNGPVGWNGLKFGWWSHKMMHLSDTQCVIKDVQWCTSRQKCWMEQKFTKGKFFLCKIFKQNREWRSVRVSFCDRNAASLLHLRTPEVLSSLNCLFLLKILIACWLETSSLQLHSFLSNLYIDSDMLCSYYNKHWRKRSEMVTSYKKVFSRRTQNWLAQSLLLISPQCW